MQEIINREVDQILASEIAKTSQSQWSSSVVLAGKKGNNYRFGINL